jgi:hypothetical protein
MMQEPGSTIHFDINEKRQMQKLAMETFLSLNNIKEPLRLGSLINRCKKRFEAFNVRE